MELYIKVAFWMGIFAMTVNLCSIAVVDYPVQKTETLGGMMFRIIIGGGFLVWSGFLLFG